MYSLDCHYLKGCINVGVLVFFVLISRILAHNKNLPTKESLGPDGLTALFCQMFSKDLLPTLNLLYKTERERRLLNSFYKASIILLPKPGKDTTKTTNQYL